MQWKGRFVITETMRQWAIEFPTHGTLSMGFAVRSPFLDRDGTKDGYETLIQAEQALESMKAMYCNLGVPEVAEVLRIVGRTVTITYPDYQPLEEVSP